MRKGHIKNIAKNFSWIIFIPLSLIGGYFISGIIHVSGHALFSGIEQERLMKILVAAKASLLFGAASTYFAYKIAPSNNKIAAAIMTGIVVFMAGSSLPSIFSTEHYSIYVDSVVPVFGSSIITYFAFKGGFKRKSKVLK